MHIAIDLQSWGHAIRSVGMQGVSGTAVSEVEGVGCSTLIVHSLRSTLSKLQLLFRRLGEEEHLTECHVGVWHATRH